MFNFSRIFVLVLVFTIFTVPAFSMDVMTVIPDNAAAFVKLDYHYNAMMKKILSLSDVLMDENTRRVTQEMKEIFGFSPLEKEFLMNFLTTTIVVLDSKDLQKDPHVGTLVELKDAELFKQYLDKIKNNIKSKGKKDIKIYPYNKAKFPIMVYEKTTGDKELLYTAFFDNIFAIGIGKENGVKVLEELQKTAANNAFSINKNKAYIKLNKNYSEKSSVFMYVSGEFIKKDTAKELPNLKVDFVDAAAFVMNYNEGQISGEGFVCFKKNSKNPIDEYLEAKPLNLESVSFLPESSLLYFVSRFIFPEKAFKDEKIVKALVELNKTLGLDFEKDIFPWLGHEYFISFSDYNIIPVPPIPTPGVFFGIGVKNTQAAKNAMEKIEAAYQLRMPDQEFKSGKEGGIDYRYIDVPSGGMLKDFTLTYMVIDKFLVFSTGKNAIKEIDKVRTGKIESLNKEPLFKNMLGSYGQNSIISGYANGDRLARLAIKFMEFKQTSEDEMKDVRSIKAIRGLGFGISNTKEGISFKAAINIDMELIKKLAAEPEDD